MAEIFVSYTSRDRNWAEWIAQQLKSFGHAVHLDAWEISAGGNIPAWVEEQHHKADHILCVMSSRYLEGPFSAQERHAGLWASASKRPNFLVPVFIECCEATTLIAPLRSCELYGLSENEAQAKLRKFFEPPAPPTRPVRFPGDAKTQAEFPGKLQALSNIPVTVPRHFLGRDEILDDIRRKLVEERPRVAITLHGLGGVGKTTIAAAYAEQHAMDYRATWFLNAEREPQLRADLVALGVALQWVLDESSEEAACREVLRRLRDEGDRILLIYDNVVDVYKLPPYLPRGGTAHVLITSRARYWQNVAEPLAIGLWPEQIGANYLIACTGRHAEHKAAEILSRELGGLPLAHEQAAAYCGSFGVSFEDYLEKFRAAPAELISGQGNHLVTVGKSFTVAIEGAAERHPAALPLVLYAAQLAANPVPVFLFAEARAKLGEPIASLTAHGLDAAVGALLDFAVVDRERIADERDPSVNTDCIHLHRLVRVVARSLLDKSDAGLTREVVLENLVGALEVVFPKDNNSRIWRLFPHVVEVLQTLSKDSGISGDRTHYSKLARLVVMAMHVTDDRQRAGNIIPDYLANVLGDFYEIEPLKGPLRALLKEHRDVWPKLEKKFLSTNNYVLRYSVADALADAYRENPPLITLHEIADKIGFGKPINEFEVGGYALNLIYARDPGSIDPKVLEKLAQRREYSGRSILGDLFLKLVFDRRKESVEDLHRLLDDNRFWQPIWDFIQTDVSLIEAAQAFMSGAGLNSEHVRPSIKKEYDRLIEVDSEVRQLLASPSCGHLTQAMLRSYWTLGQDTDLIPSAEDELAKFNQDELLQIVKLLFAHPIWVVAETAGTTLISLIARRDHSLSDKLASDPVAHSKEIERWRSIVTNLFDDENWRVQYGACEAAYIMSEHNKLSADGKKLFYSAVRRFYKSPNCKIRGNCAENLFSHILNSSASDWPESLKLFDREIRYWLRDEDCWVMEHVFCFFEGLHKRHVNFEHLLESEQSPLLAGAERWHLLDRQDFLLHIEQRKEWLRAAENAARIDGAG